MLVSIVMPCRNGARFIEASIESVLTQDYPQIDLVVADGGSTDGTLDILEKFRARDGRLRFVSQPDSGPAEAINRALARTRGTVVGWLNADDLFAPGAIRRAVQALTVNPAWLLVYGQGQHIDAAGQVLGSYPTRPPATPVEAFANGCFLCQPTAFFKRTLNLLLGPLDENLKTAFDFDYWLRAFRRFPGRIGFLDEVQAQSRLHVDCITRSQRRLVAIEGMQVIARHLGQAPEHWVLTYLEELLAQRVIASGVYDLRQHMGQVVPAVAATMTPAALESLRNRISADARLDRPVEVVVPLAEWKAASNALVPEWRDAVFSHAISLGSFCHSAEVLKRLGFRAFSGPFDWIFSNPPMVAHALEDDFSLFLDPDQYQPVPEHERVVVEANRCDHRFYRDQFGLRFMFNHHCPAEPDDYAYLQRCVTRFRESMTEISPKLLLFVTHQPLGETVVQPLMAALDRFAADCLLVAVRFCPVPEPLDVLNQGLKVTRLRRRCVTLDFPVRQLSNGVIFPDPSDNQRFAALLGTFRVSEHRRA